MQFTIYTETDAEHQIPVANALKFLIDAETIWELGLSTSITKFQLAVRERFSARLCRCRHNLNAQYVLTGEFIRTLHVRNQAIISITYAIALVTAR